jgi:hypothetical protein
MAGVLRSSQLNLLNFRPVQEAGIALPRVHQMKVNIGFAGLRWNLWRLTI